MMKTICRSCTALFRRSNTNRTTRSVSPAPDTIGSVSPAPAHRPTPRVRTQIVRTQRSSTQSFFERNLIGRFNSDAIPEALRFLSVSPAPDTIGSVSPDTPTHRTRPYTMNFDSQEARFGPTREAQSPRASTQSFLETNLRGRRFNPDATPAVLQVLAEDCIREGRLQWASEIGQHLCYKAGDVDDANKQPYFEAAIDIAKAIMVDIMENRMANFDYIKRYVTDIVTLLAVDREEHAEFFREYEAFIILPICNDMGALSISRVELPAVLEDPVALETINLNQLDPNQKLYVLCTTNAPNGILGKDGTVVFLESSLNGLQTRRTTNHPTTRDPITGYMELQITD